MTSQSPSVPPLRRPRPGVMRAAALALIATVALAFAACGGNEEETSGDAAASGGQEQIKLAAFLLATSNAFSQVELEGVKAAAEEAGNVEVTEFDGAFSGPKQLQQIEDAVASGEYDALVVFPNDGAAVVPGVRAAAEQGIEVVAGYAPIGPDINTGEPQVEGVLGTVWTPTSTKGTLLGELTVEACKKEHPDADPCKVAFIAGSTETAFTQEKLRRFKEIVGSSTKPKVEVAAVAEGEFLQAPSLKVSQDILQANPDLNVFTVDADQMALGTERAIESAGRTGEVSLIGNGATTQGIQAVKDKKWFATLVVAPFTEGKLAAKMAIDATRGTPPENPVINVWDELDVGEVYSQETQSDFEGEWSG